MSKTEFEKARDKANDWGDNKYGDAFEMGADWAYEWFEEDFIIKLAAISTASIQNTKKTIVDRLEPDHPYYTIAYGDVCAAIDREIQAREKLAKAVEALELIGETNLHGFANTSHYARKTLAEIRGEE